MSKAALARLGVLSLLWGSVFLWIKIAGAAFSPVEMVFARLVLGAAVLLGFAYARGLRLPREPRLLGHLAVAGLFGNTLPWLLFAEGERTGASSVAGIVSGTGPVWTLTAALVLGTERRLGSGRIAGMALGLAGVVLVAAPWAHDTGRVDGRAALCFLVGAISFGGSFAYIGRFLGGRGVPSLVLAGGQLGAAALLTLATVPFLGLEPVHWRTDSTVALVFLGLAGTGFAVLLNTEIITKDGPAAAATAGYLITVVSVLLGAIFLGEPLGWTVVVGTAAVLGAVALLRRRPAGPASAPVPTPAADRGRA